MKLAKLATSAALSLACASVCAAGAAVPTTFTNLNWIVTFGLPGIGNCQQLIVDATGDLASGRLVIYGALNCGLTGFSVTGSVYTAIDGSLSLSFISVGFTIACPRLVSYAGQCSVLDSAGNLRGTGLLRLQ
jgi:hypothetical protein